MQHLNVPEFQPEPPPPRGVGLVLGYQRGQDPETLYVRFQAERDTAAGEKWFELFYNAVSQRVLNVMRRLVGTTGTLAEDGLTDAFIKLWRTRQYEPGNFDAWLYRLCVRTAIDDGRKRRRRGYLLPVCDEEFEKAVEKKVSALRAEDEMLSIIDIERWVADQSADIQVVFGSLRRGMTPKDIALTIGMSIGRVYQARRVIHKELKRRMKND